MTTTIKRLNRYFLLAAAILTVSIFIMGCSSTTNLSSTNAKIKGLRFVNATPEKINPVQRQNVAVATSPTHSFTPATIETPQSAVTTASSSNEVVLSTLSQNKIQPSTAPTVIIAPQNGQSTAKVADLKANTTKVKSTKPKGNRTKMILLGLLAYMALGGAIATAKHVSDRKNAKANYGGGCKSWIVCVLLCFFLGSLGIHRFYMGYIWQGVVQLLTGGGCGIWVLIDFIRILIKDLNPKDGDYC